MFVDGKFFAGSISKSPLLDCVIGDWAFFYFFYTCFLLVLILLPDCFSVFLPRFGFCLFRRGVQQLTVGGGFIPCPFENYKEGDKLGNKGQYPGDRIGYK